MKSNMLTDGLDLHYEKRGERRPVVFLHGFGATTYTWNHVVPRLAERYTTISFDLKGFGLSPKPADDRYSAVDQADLISNFIIEKRLTDVTLIGHFFGGPLRSSRLSSFRRRDRNRFIPLYLSSRRLRTTVTIFITVLRLPLLGRLFVDVLSEEAQVAFILGVVYHDKTKITKETIAAYAKPLKEASAKTALIKTAKLIIPPHIEDIVSAYTTIRSPTLIIWGQHDKIVPLGIGSRLTNQLPNAKFIPPFPAGHAPHEEVPLLVIPEIVNFLDPMSH